MGKLIEHSITNLQSAKSVIQILKTEDPDLKEIVVPDNVYAKIAADFRNENLGIARKGPFLGARIVIMGVRIFSKQDIDLANYMAENIRKMQDDIAKDIMMDNPLLRSVKK